MVIHNVQSWRGLCGDIQCSHGEGCVVIHNVVMERAMW